MLHAHAWVYGLTDRGAQGLPAKAVVFEVLARQPAVELVRSPKDDINIRI